MILQNQCETSEVSYVHCTMSYKSQLQKGHDERTACYSWILHLQMNNHERQTVLPHHQGGARAPSA